MIEQQSFKQELLIRKLTQAGLLTAIAVAGSLFSFPVFGSKCAPVQHMVNLFAAVLLGPFWGVAIAFCASLLRNLLGLGSLLAFPGSLVGALCCGLCFAAWKRLDLACLAEAFGTGILGGLLAYPFARVFLGIQPAAFTIYIFPFFISTGAGSLAAFALLHLMARSHALKALRGW